MARTAVAEVMTRRVVYLPGETTLDETAQAMRDQQIGGVVTHGPTLAGLVTDRDIVVRAIAAGLPPQTTTLESIASRELIMVEQSATVQEAVQAMRDRDVRRLLVCDTTWASAAAVFRRMPSSLARPAVSGRIAPDISGAVRGGCPRTLGK